MTVGMPSPRCKKGKAHCRKCKSAHECSQCTSGFRVGSTGACITIPKPPAYKCAAVHLHREHARYASYEVEKAV